MLHRKFFVVDYAPSTMMDSYQVNHPPKEEESELTHSGLASLDSLLPPHSEPASSVCAFAPPFT